MRVKASSSVALKGEAAAMGAAGEGVGVTAGAGTAQAVRREIRMRIY
jgi:hypothetical protein